MSFYKSLQICRCEIKNLAQKKVAGCTMFAHPANKRVKAVLPTQVPTSDMTNCVQLTRSCNDK